MSKQVNIRLAETDILSLDAVAKSTGRSRSWLVQRAVQKLVADEQAHVDAVQRAMAESDAGLGRPAEEYLGALERRILARLQKGAA
jgi:predicted transcriptional regulator